MSKILGKFLPNFEEILINVMRFKKPWLRVKSVNFDFSAKSSSTDYNESNKPTSKCLAYIGSEKLLVEMVPKNELLHFSTFCAILKSLFFTLSHQYNKIIKY